jgi:tRNA modification GTPase
MDTIFALATAPGRAGVAVIRVSGSDARVAAEKLVGPDLPLSGRRLRRVRDHDGEVLDEALILTFEGPGSFTGEDVVEFQTHGSQAVVGAVLDSLGAIDTLRLAEPGEFTRRALENGKMDLAQVEGLADLIEAETTAQRRQAQALFRGALSDLTERWRHDLIRAAALIEATIDFADEDVPEDVSAEVRALITGVADDLDHQISGVKIAERIRSGFEVAIVGPPNAGKSTLLNTLAGRPAALTSEIAGTTRDVIEVRMDLAGLPVTLLDTAGLRETADMVEQMGVALARDRARSADLRVCLVADPSTIGIELDPEDIVVRPKADLFPGLGGGVSGLTGEGIDALVDRIGSVLSQRSATAGLATRTRHRDAMARARAALNTTSQLLERGPDGYELVADELRRAIRALESLVGRVDVECLLDEIFASFCLGK